MSAIREKNIMVLFVSANSANAMKNPKAFAILGETHKSRQTNESAVRYMYQLLRRQGKRLDHIFLITSKASKRKVNLAGPGEAEDRKSPLDVLYELMDELSLRELCRTKDYDEDAAPEACILKVAEIAADIQRYAAEAAGETPCRFFLHADMTGGYRHASMMMLAVLQLLTSITTQEAKSSFAIGRILYANAPIKNEKHEIIRQGTVDDVTEIQRMMTLITGANEFVNYGSVKAIEAYFENRPGESMMPELRALLTAMRRFSEAINVCQVSAIRRELKNLAQNIDVFQSAAEALSQEEPGHVQERLFSSITETIRKEYGSILKEQASNIDIIQWCLDKGFLQQALTLCTEWLPSEIVDRHIAYTDQEVISAYCKEKASTNFGTWQKNLLTAYDCGEAKNATGARPGKLYDILQAYCKGKKTLENVIEESGKICQEFSQAMKEYNKFHYAFMNGYLTYLSSNYLEWKYPHMEKLIYQEYQRRKCTQEFQGSWSDFLYQQDWNQMASEVFIHITSRMLASMFGLKETRSIRLNPPGKREELTAALEAIPEPEGENPKFYEANRKQRGLFSSGELVTDYRLVDAVRCLFDYNRIRLARNQTNHANAERACSADDLHRMMQGTLDRLQHLQR